MEKAKKFLDSLSSFFDCKAPSILENRISSMFPPLDDEMVEEICNSSIKILQAQPSLVQVNSPVVLVGDVHGNFVDLIRIFQIFGQPSKTKYVFLGDYVDRGTYSVHVIITLFSMLVAYPDNIVLLRGNHEFPAINRIYGFYDECKERFKGDEIWNLFQIVFSWLPFTAVVNDSIFCVHGGLSPNFIEVDDLKGIVRPILNYDESPIVQDIVWSDPDADSDLFQSSLRGVGVLFGSEVVRQFLVKNSLKLIIRAHQCISNGVESFALKMGMTIFSCSNYLGQVPNKAGMALVKNENEIEIHSFSKNLPEGRPLLMKFEPNSLGLRNFIPSFSNIPGNVRSSAVVHTQNLSLSLGHPTETQKPKKLIRPSSRGSGSSANLSKSQIVTSSKVKSMRK